MTNAQPKRPETGSAKDPTGDLLDQLVADKLPELLPSHPDHFEQEKKDGST
jgi:hypothetical protein